MIVRAIDNLHDWQFGKGLNDYRFNQLAVVQNINTRLNSFLGDCFFDQGAGIDWFTFIGSKNQLGLNLAISAVILNTLNVLSMIQLSVNLTDERVFTVSYNVSTTFGVVSSTTTGSV
jgi:hypothetical protein